MYSPAFPPSPPPTPLSLHAVMERVSLGVGVYTQKLRACREELSDIAARREAAAARAQCAQATLHYKGDEVRALQAQVAAAEEEVRTCAQLAAAKQQEVRGAERAIEFLQAQAGVMRDVWGSVEPLLDASPPAAEVAAEDDPLDWARTEAFMDALCGAEEQWVL